MVLDRLFPGWALKRALARHRLAQVQANFEAAKPTRTHPRRGSVMSPDALMQQAGTNLRAYSRYLDENHDLMVGVLNDIANRVVGVGLSIEPMTVDTRGNPLEAFNREIAADWQEFSAAPETTGEMPMQGEYGVERLVCRSLMRDGEILVQHVFGRRYPYRGEVPYVAELLEADYLPFELQKADPLIVQGIEKDGWGRPVAYHFLREHPYDQGIGRGSSLLATQETVRRRANIVSHLKIAKRLRQTRGTPLAHSIIHRLADLKDYEESERIAARMNADIGGVITNPPAALGEASDGQPPVQELDMANGMWWTKVEGADIKMMDATRPNTGLESFRDGQVRMLAAGTNTRYSSIAKNYNGTYSSQRQELVEGAVGYESIREYMVQRFYAPMRRFRIDAAVLAGRLRLPATLDRRSLYWADYRGPSLPQIDIQKEMKGREIAQANRWTSRQQNTRDLGNDPNIVDQQIARDAGAGTIESDGEGGEVLRWRA